METFYQLFLPKYQYFFIFFYCSAVRYHTTYGYCTVLLAFAKRTTQAQSPRLVLINDLCTHFSLCRHLHHVLRTPQLFTTFIPCNAPPSSPHRPCSPSPAAHNPALTYFSRTHVHPPVSLVLVTSSPRAVPLPQVRLHPQPLTPLPLSPTYVLPYLLVNPHISQLYSMLNLSHLRCQPFVLPCVSVSLLMTIPL